MRLEFTAKIKPLPSYQEVYLSKMSGGSNEKSVTSSRLPSFKDRTDLGKRRVQLQPFGKSSGRATFTPNLNYQRPANKLEPPKSSDSSQTQTSRLNLPSPSRPKKSFTPRTFIQQTGGIFSEGIGAQKAKLPSPSKRSGASTPSPSKKGASKDGKAAPPEVVEKQINSETHAPAIGDTSKLRKSISSPKSELPKRKVPASQLKGGNRKFKNLKKYEDYNELVRADDFIADLPPNDPNNPPVVLPLGFRLSSENKEGSVRPPECVPPSSSQFNMIEWLKRGVSGDPDTPLSVLQMPQDKLAELGEGKIGELEVNAKGQARIVLASGGYIRLRPGIVPSFFQDAVHLEAERGTLTSLGHVEGTLLGSAEEMPVPVRHFAATQPECIDLEAPTTTAVSRKISFVPRQTNPGSSVS